MAEPTWLDEGARERIRIECLTIESTWENTRNALIALFDAFVDEYCAAGAPDGDAGPLEQIPVLVYETAVSRQWLRDRPVQPVRGPVRSVKLSDGRVSLLRPSPVAVPDEALTARIGRFPVKPADLESFYKILFRPIRACLARIGRMRIAADDATGPTSESSVSTGALKSQAADNEGASEGKRKIQEITIPGVAWNNVEVVVSDQELQVSVHGKTRVISFLEAGFGKRDQNLELLKFLAASRGKLDADKFTLPRQSKTPLKSRISRLRRHLQNLIAIGENPIFYHKAAELYVCSFQIRISTDDSFPTPANAKWFDFHFHERKDGRINVSASRNRSFRTPIVEGIAGSSVLETIPQPDFDVSHIYSLGTLGFHPTGAALTKQGNALTALLRGGGRLRRNGDDTAVLKLAEWLRKWTGLSDDPLQFAGNSRLWTAAFECTSELAPRE